MPGPWRGVCRLGVLVSSQGSVRRPGIPFVGPRDPEAGKSNELLLWKSVFLFLPTSPLERGV